MTELARAVRLAAARTCLDCRSWPCRCSADPDGAMPDFALRIEPCACNGPAIAVGGSAANVRAAVEQHNATPEHHAWRAAREAGEAPIAV